MSGDTTTLRDHGRATPALHYAFTRQPAASPPMWCNSHARVRYFRSATRDLRRHELAVESRAQDRGKDRALMTPETNMEMRIISAVSNISPHPLEEALHRSWRASGSATYI